MSSGRKSERDNGQEPAESAALWRRSQSHFFGIARLRRLSRSDPSHRTKRLNGSQALQADALDFLGDTLTYGISLAVIGASLRTRATAALFKGISLTLMGIWVFGSTAHHVLILAVPRAEIMGGIGALALAANVASVLVLMRYKDGDANVRSSGYVRAMMPSAMSLSCWRRSGSGARRLHGPISWLRRLWRACSSTLPCRSSRSQEPSSDGHVPQAPTARCFLTRPNSNLPSAPELDDADTGQSYGDTRQIPGRGRYTVDVPQPQ